MYFMYVCLFVCEQNVCVYDFVMLQYVKVSCVFCFLAVKFCTEGSALAGWLCSSLSTQQQHHHISFNQLKKNLTWNSTIDKIMWFQNRLKGGCSDHFGQKISVCRQLSVFSFLGHLHKLCVYTLSLRLQFACHEILATLATLAPTVSWLRKVILIQLCRKSI